MKNGFTLVELLAVIVILAVLALIATPVVLSIIDDAKESAMLRSAEMYLSGVENAVMRENMNSGGNFRPNSCEILNGNMTCDSTNVEVEVDGEVPYAGSIEFENGKIKQVTLNYTSGTIIKDPSGNLVYEGAGTGKTLDTICNYQNNGVAEKTAGAKYSCEVKEGTSYNFYVLTTPAEGDTTINLIMDRNICEDGTPTEEGKTCLVAWISDSTSGCGSDGDRCATNDLGPVTAMDYLYNATKVWTNVNPINYAYNDREFQNSIDGLGYTSFVSVNGIATITQLTGSRVTIGSETEPLRARMPISTQIFEGSTPIYKGELASSNGSNEYLYENLDGSDWYGSGPQPINNISGIYGYWTLSSNPSDGGYALALLYDGYVNIDNDITENVYYGKGVRPIINLKLQ